MSIYRTKERKGGNLIRRMRLRRADGEIYLERWGISHKRIGGILLHRMTAPDPGVDLHDHPWTFITIPLWGAYIEERADTRQAPIMARIAELHHDTCRRGVVTVVSWLRPKRMRLDECHRIIRLKRKTVWTLVLNGPVRRGWGFYMPGGYVDQYTYDATVRMQRRDLYNEVG